MNHYRFIPSGYIEVSANSEAEARELLRNCIVSTVTHNVYSDGKLKSNANVFLCIVPTNLMDVVDENYDSIRAK